MAKRRGYICCNWHNEILHVSNIYCTRTVCVRSLTPATPSRGGGVIFVSVSRATTYSIVILSSCDKLWKCRYVYMVYIGRACRCRSLMVCVCVSVFFFFFWYFVVVVFTHCNVSALRYFVFVVDLWFTMEHTTRVQLNIGLLFMMPKGISWHSHSTNSNTSASTSSTTTTVATTNSVHIKSGVVKSACLLNICLQNCDQPIYRRFGAGKGVG